MKILFLIMFLTLTLVAKAEPIDGRQVKGERYLAACASPMNNAFCSGLWACQNETELSAQNLNCKISNFKADYLRQPDRVLSGKTYAVYSCVAEYWLQCFKR